EPAGERMPGDRLVPDAFEDLLTRRGVRVAGGCDEPGLVGTHVECRTDRDREPFGRRTEQGHAVVVEDSGVPVGAGALRAGIVDGLVERAVADLLDVMA